MSRLVDRLLWWARARANRGRVALLVLVGLGAAFLVRLAAPHIYHGIAIVFRIGPQHDYWWAATDDPARDHSLTTIGILNLANVQPGMSVADVGAGGGYLAMKFAKVVGPQGRVVATDADPHMIEILRWEAWRRGFSQVEARHVKAREVGLEPGGYDRVVILNVYPFLECDPAGKQYLHDLVSALRPGGKLIIHHDFVHTPDWESTRGKRLPCEQADAVLLAAWAEPHAKLEHVESITPPHPRPRGENAGYRLVLTRHTTASSHGQ